MLIIPIAKYLHVVRKNVARYLKYKLNYCIFPYINIIKILKIYMYMYIVLVFFSTWYKNNYVKLSYVKDFGEDARTKSRDVNV